jgi:hypothetical protein
MRQLVSSKLVYLIEHITALGMTPVMPDGLRFNAAAMSEGLSSSPCPK